MTNEYPIFVQSGGTVALSEGLTVDFGDLPEENIWEIRCLVWFGLNDHLKTNPKKIHVKIPNNIRKKYPGQLNVIVTEDDDMKKRWHMPISGWIHVPPALEAEYIRIGYIDKKEK